MLGVTQVTDRPSISTIAAGQMAATAERIGVGAFTRWRHHDPMADGDGTSETNEVNQAHDQRPSQLEVVLGDITDEPVAAIVNAANSSLLGGGGVDGAIHRAAGPELVAHCRHLGGCKTGLAKVTPGFDLAARWVIHTVGPVWRGGDQGEPEALTSCYQESMTRADEVGAESVAFPAISTGIFGYPIELAAQIAIETVMAADTAVELVRFVCFDEDDADIYADLLARKA